VHEVVSGHYFQLALSWAPRDIVRRHPLGVRGRDALETAGKMPALLD
jgi:hypothetical protein